ncbi:MAG: InlB B-repeat-containing protein, partial [Oscillibacter sp.]|nr:InlB B-repeat-containing protein [Oscillibacter sp.]
MKRLIKHFSSLIAFASLFAVLTLTAGAAETANFDMSLVFNAETRLVVYVDGEQSDELSDSYDCGSAVELTAPDVSGKSFSHWEADGSVVSYANPLKLTMNAHTALYAVYADAAPTAAPVAGFTSITATNDGESISFQAIAAPENGGTVTAAGIVYSATAASDDALRIGGTDVENVAAEKITDSTTTLPKSILDDNNCYMLQFTPDSGATVYHARAYVTVGSDTAYGDVKDVKLSDLESGVSMISNLNGFNPTDGLDDKLAELMAGVHAVTFYPNGGIGIAYAQAFTPGEAMTLNANKFTHPEKPFNCWNTKADGTGASYADKASVTLTENLTLYAQWKEPATVSNAPTANTLTYNSEAQTLVTEGITTEGTMQYALGNDATTAPTGEYGATIPTGTNAKTYYVWYKVVGDSHHTDSAPACVTVTINKA